MAKRHINAKRYDDAETALSKVFADAPGHSEAKSLQAQIEKVREGDGKTAGERKTLTINGVEYAFRWRPAGSFTMGSPEWEEGRSDNETQHRVTLTKGFWLLETEVTQKMWKSAMGTHPSCFCSTGKGSSLVSGMNTDDFPVEQVSWDDCQNFIRKLQSSAPDGWEFSLPTEAQWEYACRAGTMTPYNFGDKISVYQANYGYRLSGDPLGDSSTSFTYVKDTLGRTTKVKSYVANVWGLRDMHGNVSEWCADYFRNYLNDGKPDPMCSTISFARISRGGSWCSGAELCRSAYRGGAPPFSQIICLGLRLA